MQRLEVSGAVRHIKGSLDVKGLSMPSQLQINKVTLIYCDYTLKISDK